MMCRKIFEDWRHALGWITIAVFTVSVLASIYLVVAMFSLDDYTYEDAISVIGTAEVVAVPDIASFNFTISEAAESIEVAQNMVVAKNSSAVDYLKEIGVEETDIKTESYRVYPKYEWISEPCTRNICPPGNRKLVGYEVSQTTLVKVRDTSKTGDILSELGKRGLSYIGDLYFDVDDPQALEEEARNRAIENAKRKAEELSEKLGVKLDDIIGFSEDVVPIGYDGPTFETLDFGAKMNSGIQAGEQDVYSTVYITYEID